MQITIIINCDLKTSIHIHTHTHIHNAIKVTIDYEIKTINITCKRETIEINNELQLCS